MPRDRSRLCTGDATPIRVPKSEVPKCCLWYCGSESGRAIAIRLDLDRARVVFWHDDRKHDQVVRLVYSRTNFGGRRAWFACPICRRRIGVLWFYIWGGWDWRCRHCLNLTYYSQRLSPEWRVRYRVEKIRRRLGATGDVWSGEIAKPKWMRWSTFERLLQRHDMHFERMLELENVAFRRIARLVGS